MSAEVALGLSSSVADECVNDRGVVFTALEGLHLDCVDPAWAALVCGHSFDPGFFSCMLLIQRPYPMERFTPAAR